MYYIYITTNLHRTVLYIGVTNNIIRRLSEHELKIDSACFTAKYNAFYCIYFEQYDDIYTALCREKTLKGWRREKKIALIETVNPAWRFLNKEIISN